MTFKQQINLMAKLEEMKNTRDFFDEFSQIEQKIRVKGDFPTIENIVLLEVFKESLEAVYETPDFPNCHKVIKTSTNIIETVQKKLMNLSISIEGTGRKEFVKINFPTSETDIEKEETKDIIDKLADKLG